MRVIAGALRGRMLKTGQGPGYRPAMGKVREAVFSMLEARGVDWQGLRVLDVFAGSGSLGIEALSRGAGEAWFLEQSRQAAAILRDNLTGLGLEGSRWRIVGGDALKALSVQPERPFGLVFADPPYGQALLAPTLDKLLQNHWIQEGGMILAEVEASLDLPALCACHLHTLTDRQYGQTRILLWRLGIPGWLSIPGPSIP